MTPDRWQQIEEVFHAALEVDLSERSSFLDARTDGDDELRNEVEKLISQFEDASSFIEQPVFDSGKSGFLSALLDETDDDPMVDKLLGSYRIEREVGRGGMGAVYEAVRADGEFRRKVAIKIVKRGVDTDFVLRRFRNERQILAALDHPFITRLIDGGTTDDGRPYFVMDYIDGLPLYRFADKNTLSINQRLELFSSIGEAVEYAHQRRVIHRDLKPSNILVTPDASPRLLDFGIAKLLDPEMSFETLQPTATALRMMTIDYASPEQVRGEKVDFTTDVYSLGVVLYELLTGYRPYRIQSRAPHEIAKAICEDEPPLPSHVTGGAIEAVAVAVSRSATTLVGSFDLKKNHENVTNELRGNLDNIVMKALEKEPDKRYQSVVDLCSDIKRHLDGKAVDAPQYSSKRKSEPVSPIAENVKLIAVLPLKLLNFSASENTDENYLSIGLADAIISRLTSVQDFTVRPTSSISGYENSDIDPLQAGRELGVDFVLDGRIKKAGDVMRISLQMLDVQKESTTWAGQFDETFTDILTLEDVISEQVAEALVSQVTGENKVQLGKRGTDNSQAYEAYLKGRFYWNQFTPDALPKAIEQFERAVEVDPNYALAHVGVADFYIWATIYGLMPAAESYRHAEISVKRALEIDDRLGEAWATFGLVQDSKFDWAAGKRCHEKAIELNPTYPNAHEWYSVNLVGSGNFAEGIKEIERAEELDPLSLRTKSMVAWTKCQAHQFADALAKAEEIVDLDPNFPQGHLQKGYALIELGRATEAIGEIEKAMALMPESPLLDFILASALASAGRREDAQKVFNEMKADARKAFVKSIFLGYAAVAAGEIDEAFSYFDQAADEFDPWLVWFGTDLKLEPIRKDKRYLELMRRTKNPMLEQFEKKFFAKEKLSIAVLPLQLIGSPTGSLDDEYLGVGLADAMITRLSQIRRIVVRPTSSVMKYSKYEDPFGIGGELSVDFVLCGTLRRAGERIRISAQLLNVASDATVWADKFDEKFTDVLELEDTVADRVARLLLPQLTGEEEQKLAKRGTDKPEAYEAYLKGRTSWLSSTPDGLAKALVCFNEAISIDPEYAAPYAGIADYHNFLSVFGIMAPYDSFPAAKENAEKALDLDPELADAYVSLGMTAYCYDWDFEQSERLFTKAIDLSPNLVSAHMWYAHFLSLIGRNEEAIYQIGRADEIAPENYSIKIIHAFLLRNAREFEKSRQKILEAHSLQPDHYLAMQAHSWNVLALKNFDEAEAECRKAVAADTGLNMSSYALAFVLAAEGKRDEALEIANKLIDIRKKNYVPPCYLAQIFTALGDIDRAFEWFETGYEERDCWEPWLTVDPRFDLLRDDPRYFKLVQKIYPQSKTEEPIHQSQIPTKIYKAEQLKGTKSEERKKVTRAENTKLSFFYRQRFKFIGLAALSVLALIAYATGILTVKFASDGLTIETDKADASKQKDALPASAPAITPNSIVILPFTAADAVNNDLGVGLADSLTSKLGAVKRLTVISANSGRAVAKKDRQEISKELGVQYIVTSSLEKSDLGFRVVSELFDGQNDKQMWRADLDIDSKPDELFTVVNKMSEKILEAIKIEALPVEKVQFEKTYTKNGLAYELYLIGRSQMVIRSPETIRKAIAAFNRAKEQDPDFVLAYVGLADAYNMQSLYEIPAPPDSYPNALENAKKALAIDPELAEAHVSLGYATFYYLRDRAAAELEFRRAIQINPSYAQAHSWFSSFLIATNRLPEAVSEAETSKRLDPMALTSGTSMAYFYSRDFERSIQQAEASLALNPNFIPAIKLLRWNYSSQGRYEDAKRSFLKERSSDVEGSVADWYMIEAQVEALSGNKVEIKAKLDGYVNEKSVKENPNAYAYEIALAYNALGEREKAFEWLEKAEVARSFGFNFLEVDHRLESLKGDLRFQKLLQKLTSPKN